MKKVLIISALGAMFMASCADEFDQTYKVGRPDMTAEYAYLEAYEPLKEYVDNSDFHLGLAVAAPDYNKQELVYSLANSNFTEIVAGNAMKMASVVNDKGEMNFATVSEFVNNATDAGMSVYGHTLAWHSQQPVKWLNSLLKDKELDIDPDSKIETLMTSFSYENQADGPFPHYPMGCEPPIINGALHFVPTGDWSQFFIFPGGNNQLTEGDYLVRLYMASNKDADGVQLTIQNGWGGDAQNMTMPVPVVAGDQVYELNYPGITASPSAGYDVILKPQTADATLDVKKIEFYKLESPAVEVEKEVNFYTYENKPDGPFPHYPMGCEPPIQNGALHFVPNGGWSQFFVVPGGDNQLDEGDYVFYVDMAADKEASGVQLTVQNGWGGDAQNFTQAIPVKAGRNTYALKFPGLTGSPSKNYDVILKPQTADATLDFYSLKVCKIEKLNSIPLTPEERKDTLTWAMEKWIAGMMEACDGKVKAWDVVNEAISGGDPDGEGVYALQHGTPDNTTDFFWQDADKLGDLDYVRTAVRLARQYGPEDIKLFINDYNLESDWDQNNKLKSLIAWIKRWEADGVTKIDGIGSQMHISCYANPTTQASKKAAIENMLKLMASSGKLCRISELDMGYVDADGNSVKTVDMTEEMHHQMAELYTFVIEKYKEIIPVNQQWGICQWCATDAPADSGWRKGEPVGLWDSNYYRKHTYAGFADGLAGK
ncbi:MAG: endo-1,4-beta-xylanase [Prevotella sp.]|nr:endo-1,4-beta-xylanase [Prevotella sp.]